MILNSVSLKKWQMKLILPALCVALDLISIPHVTMDIIDFVLLPVHKRKGLLICADKNRRVAKQETEDSLNTIWNENLNTKQINCPEIIQEMEVITNHISFTGHKTL